VRDCLGLRSFTSQVALVDVRCDVNAPAGCAKRTMIVAG
jgi:hypothetical protein